MFISKKKFEMALEQIQKLEELLKSKTEELEYHEQVSANIKELEVRQFKLNNDIDKLAEKKVLITEDIKLLEVRLKTLLNDIEKAKELKHYEQVSANIRELEVRQLKLNNSINKLMEKKILITEDIKLLEVRSKTLLSDIDKVEELIQQKNNSLGLLRKAEESALENTKQFGIQIAESKNKLQRLEILIKDKEIMYEKYLERNQAVEIQKLGILDFTSKFDTPITYLQHSIDNLENRVNNKVKIVNLMKEDKLLKRINQETSIENMLHCTKNLILLNYQNEVELIMLKLKRGNIENITNKMHHAFKNSNDIAYGTGYQISKEYHEIMLRDLELIYRGILLKNEEKERLRVLKEEELERKRVEKEIKDKLRELLTREKYLIKEKVSIEKQIKLQGQQQRLILKLNELQDALGLVQKKRNEIERRESISTSGYVYIISNIGSFGEGIYKIGMTRRLDPLERIRELSSASVPFEFDVHAMILTDDAPKSENELHKMLHKQRVNLVNNRKEFFYVDLEKIKQAIVELIGTDIIFNEKPKATQYFETLFIKQQLLAYQNSNN